MVGFPLGQRRALQLPCPGDCWTPILTLSPTHMSHVRRVCKPRESLSHNTDWYCMPATTPGAGDKKRAKQMWLLTLKSSERDGN